MQTVSALWNTLFSADHKKEYRFDINGLSYYAEDLKGDPVINKPLMDKPAIGRVCTGSLQIKVFPKADIPKAALVDAYCRLVSVDGASTSEWLPQGKFYISKRSGTSPLSLECKDYMIRSGVTYQDKTAFDEWPQNMNAVLAEICTIMDVQLDARTQINNGYTIDYPNEDTLISEVLSVIAIANGGNWIMTETGKLRLIRITSPGTAVQSIGKSHFGFKSLGKTQLISKVILTDNTNNKFEAGDDTGITLTANCNAATQIMANNLCGTGDYALGNGEIVLSNASLTKGELTVYTGSIANGCLTLIQNSILYGVSYEPYSLTNAFLDPAVELGDTISVTERSDITHSVIAFGMKINCTIGYTVTLTAGIDDETEDEFPYITMRQLSINRSVRTDQTYFGNKINRKDGFVSELLVNGESQAKMTANATVFSMQQNVNGRWEDRIFFDTVSGKYVISADVTINGVVTFTDLSTSGSTIINGDNITTGKIKNSSGSMVIDLDAGTISVGGQDVESALRTVENAITLLASSQMFTKAAGASSYTPATITLTASTSGSMASYKWYKDNTLISGQTASTLSVSPSDISGNSATYKVVGTDAEGKTYTDVLSIAKLADGQDGQPGAAGKGISAVTNYYLASASSSGVTRETSGWTTAVQTIDATKKYLWTYEQITYTSGSPTYTDPTIIGTYGRDGTNGRGITSIVEYYAKNNSSSTAPADNAFSTTLQVVDANNRYLWNREKITYTDNTSEWTSKRIIGQYSADGQPGAAGADGYTVILGDEFIEVPVYSTRIPIAADSYSCTVKTYKGVTALTAVAPTATLAEGQFKVEVLNSISGVTVTQATPGTIVCSVDTGHASDAIPDSSALSLKITVYGGFVINSAIIIHANMNTVTVEQQATITAQGSEIDLKVNKSGVIAAINISSEGVVIDAAKVDLSGLVTVSSLSAGTTTINGGCITTGTIDASQVTITNLNAGNISAGTLSASYISGGTLNCNLITVSNLSASSINSGTLSASRISGGTLDCSLITVSSLSASAITSGTLNCSNITVSNLSASSITSGTLDCSKVTVSNLSASRITSGTLDCSKVTVSNLNASSITAGTISASLIDVDSLKVNKLYTASGSLGKTLIQYNSNTTYVGGDGSSWGGTNTFIYGAQNVCIGSYNSWGQRAVFDTSTRCFRPDNASYGWTLGNATYPWSALYTRESCIGTATNGKVGFFGTTPVSKKKVTKPSSSASEADVRTVLINLCEALQGYGLLSNY